MIRGVNATTVFCANSRKFKIHSMAVDCTSSSNTVQYLRCMAQS